MRPSFKYGILASSIFVIAKLLAYMFKVINESWVDSGLIFLALLLLIVAVVLSIWETRKGLDQQPGFFDEFRTGVQASVWFALVVAISTYLYYSKIDAYYFTDRIDQVIENARQISDADFEKLKENSNKPDFSRDTFVQNQKELAEMIFSPFNHSTFLMLIYLVVGVVYTVVTVPLIKRFFPKFK